MDSARSQALAKYYRVQADACRQMAQQASDRGGKAVVFDLVKPVRAARDCLGAGGEAKLNGRKHAPGLEHMAISRLRKAAHRRR